MIYFQWTDNLKMNANEEAVFRNTASMPVFIKNFLDLFVNAPKTKENYM